MDKPIFGRDAEIELFHDVLASSASEFVAITGRRRIGKTYLVNQFFGKDICFYMTGVQDQPQKAQLEVFTQELMKRQKKFIPTPASWTEAFYLLRQYLDSIKTQGKKIVFFDELPWMDTPKSGFLQTFAHFWNSYANWTKDIVLVIAGSSTSWIVNKVYGDRGGLHNRVTKRIWLEPFNLQQTEEFLLSKRIRLSRYDITLIYMAMGGVPFYLNEIKRGESAAQAIQRLFFEPDALLRSEFENLYNSIFHKADAHIRVVKTLAKHRYGLQRTDLLKKAKITNSGGGSKILEELVITGYIAEMLPFGKKQSGNKYVLNDMYSMFYLNFVAGSEFQKWESCFNTAKYKIWTGLTFERVCFMHQEQINKALGIHGISTRSMHLTLFDENKKMEAQIDMLIERADNVFNLCEIKFYEHEYKMKELDATNIRHKMAKLRPLIKNRQSIFPTLITTFGAERNMHYLSIIQNEILLDDLFVAGTVR